MKKVITGIILVTFILLVMMKSLYVEWNELFVIAASLSLVAIALNIKSKQLFTAISSSAIIGFLLFWIFGFIDLTVDHFLYYLPTGNEDGSPKTLGMKINEFRDDLFVGSLLSMVFVVFVSSLALFIFRKTSKTFA